MPIRGALLWGIGAAFLAGCGSSNPGKGVQVSAKQQVEKAEPTHIAFGDVARESGLNHSYPLQARPMRVLEAFGCGCAAFDADNDGWQDVLLVANPRPVLYRNQGKGKFLDVSPSSGFDDAGEDLFGCAIGDYDGDGLLDVLLTGFHRLALYKNLGDFHFQLVTEQAGLDPKNRGRWSSSAGFMDLDGDQDLDLVIVNFVEFGPHVKQYCEFKQGILAGCIPKHYVAEKGEIWRNTGGGRFELVPPENGMKEVHGVGLVLAFSDINHDGRMDFYIGNDGAPADMLVNRGEMKFENIGEFSGLAYDSRGVPPAAMGSDWGDFDRDGELDLAVSNFQDLGFLVFRNLGDKQFLDSSSPTGLAALSRNRLGFGTKWVDFDNDGWVDLFFTNGHVYDNAGEAVGPEVLFRQPVMLLHNRQGGSFVDLAPDMGKDVMRPMVGRGSASADFDNDGQVDLLAVDFEGPVMLLRNRSQAGNHWITLDLRAAAPNVFAYGASLKAKTGEQVWRGEVSSASSYLSSSDPRIHWGLGKATRLDELTIRWPNGKSQTLRDVPADQILKISQQP